MWLQGAYIHDAVAIALANAFSRGSNHKYLSEPYKLKTSEDKEQLIANEEILKGLVMSFAEKHKE